MIFITNQTTFTRGRWSQSKVELSGSDLQNIINTAQGINSGIAVDPSGEEDVFLVPEVSRLKERELIFSPELCALCSQNLIVNNNT